jgi:hypothetical protein
VDEALVQGLARELGEVWKAEIAERGART